MDEKDYDFNRSRDLDLPKDMERESQRIIGELYGEIGSITKCKTIEEFGKYRFKLVKKFDELIGQLKNEIIE